MKRIKILDCTLRDGGYVNSWNFGKDNISKIVSGLCNAGIDYIECGFFKDSLYNENVTLFSDLSQIITFEEMSNITLMINIGEFDCKKLPSAQSKNLTLRIAFKKWQYKEALETCSILKEKGYRIFMNPMHTDSYSENELKILCTDVNKIHPNALTIVDTTGGMTEENVLNIYKILDELLSKDIAIGFHSHNNLGISFTNARTLTENNTLNRTLIIDSTVFGMGRGAGNICTEELAKYLNENNGSKYDVMQVLKLSNECITPIFKKTPWGASAPYYIAALNHCHPNYAKYISDYGDINFERMNKILSSIPNEYKRNYNVEMIKQLCY